MKLVSIAERKQFRICKMQKRKNTKMQNYKITKLQKGAKSIFPIDKENAYILQRKTKKANRKSGLYIVRKCAENIPQKVKWDTIKGEMGHNKSRFGASGVWITRWSNKGKLKNGRADSRLIFAFLCFCK